MQVSYLIYVVLLKCNHFFHVAYNLDSLYYRFHNYCRQENPQLPYVRSLVSWPLHSANSRLSQLDFPFMSRWGPGPSVRGKEGSPESLRTVAPDSVSAVSEGDFLFHPHRVCRKRPGGYTHADHWSFSFLFIGQVSHAGPAPWHVARVLSSSLGAVILAHQPPAWCPTGTTGQRFQNGTCHFPSKLLFCVLN